MFFNDKLIIKFKTTKKNKKKSYAYKKIKKNIKHIKLSQHKLKRKAMHTKKLKRISNILNYHNINYN
jgi:hypothetical protein